MRYILIILSVIAIYYMPISAQGQRKLALVIGNASYEKSPLKNPLNDADDISAKLIALGFDVITAKDCKTKHEMRTNVNKFCAKAANADAGVFYYSGHGMQLPENGGNYLIPTEAEMEYEADVPEECISLHYVLQRMEDCGINMKVAIIDACRDNPFRTWERDGLKGLTTTGSAPYGTFIAFATSANNVADDGKGRNSPFTKAFLNALEEGNSEICHVFKKVSGLVKKYTNNKQHPWSYNDLSDDFFFAESITIKSPTLDVNEDNSQSINIYNELKDGIENLNKLYELLTKNKQTEEN